MSNDSWFKTKEASEVYAVLTYNLIRNIEIINDSILKMDDNKVDRVNVMIQLAAFSAEQERENIICCINIDTIYTVLNQSNSAPEKPTLN